VELEVLKNIRY